MKTVFCTGGSVVVDDDTADAILEYSSALARLRLMGTVTIVDQASEKSSSQVVLTVGLGIALTVRSGPTTTSDTSGDIRTRLAALDPPVASMLDVDPRTDYDADIDVLYAHADSVGMF